MDGSASRQSIIGVLSLAILQVLFFPISIVISLIGIVAAIILVPALLLFAIIFVPNDDDTAEILLIIIAAALLYAIFAPVATVLAIISYIIEIFDILLAPVFPTSAPKASSNTVLTSQSPTTAPHSTNSTLLEETTSDIMHHLSTALQTPLDTIKAVFQSENTLRDVSPNDKEDMECEIATFLCQTNNLVDALPF
jgi:hypothetical protein